MQVLAPARPQVRDMVICRVMALEGSCAPMRWGEGRLFAGCARRKAAKAGAALS